MVLTVALMALLLSMPGGKNLAIGTSDGADVPTTALDDRIWSPEDVDREPEPLNYDQIAEGIGYPKVAYDAGIQGDVTLRILVDEKGNYVSHEVLESYHPLLGIACEVFSPLLTFKPAYRNGSAVKCYTEVSYHFEIPEYGN